MTYVRISTDLYCLSSHPSSLISYRYCPARSTDTCVRFRPAASSAALQWTSDLNSLWSFLLHSAHSAGKQPLPAHCRDWCCRLMVVAKLLRQCPSSLYWMIHTILLPSRLARPCISGASLLWLHRSSTLSCPLHVPLPPQHLTQVLPEPTIVRIQGELHLQARQRAVSCTNHDERTS